MTIIHYIHSTTVKHLCMYKYHLSFGATLYWSLGWSLHTYRVHCTVQYISRLSLCKNVNVIASCTCKHTYLRTSSCLPQNISLFAVRMSVPLMCTGQEAMNIIYVHTYVRMVDTIVNFAFHFAQTNTKRFNGPFHFRLFSVRSYRSVSFHSSKTNCVDQYQLTQQFYGHVYV